MLRSLFGRRLLPTTDLYFMHHLRDRVAPALALPRTRRRCPVRVFAPNVFVCGRRAVVIRYARPKDIIRLERLRPERVFYLVDDNFKELAEAPGLPEDYRRRLQVFARDMLPRIEALADVIVAPNRYLLASYPRHEHAILEPGYVRVLSDEVHWEAPSHLKLAFLGTRSHLGDLEQIAPALAAVVERNPSVTLTTYLGPHAPRELSGRDRIFHHKPLGWATFKRDVLLGECFHIAIAPMRATPFNRGRSFNKVLDHAAVGAAGLYSAGPPVADVIEHGKDGLLIGDDPDAWLGALEGLLHDHARARSLAAEGANLARRIGDPLRVRRFWAERLGFPP